MATKLDTLNGLTVQQSIFIKEYHLTGNGLRAALKAGYAERSAASQATRLLNKEDVKQALSLLQKESEKNFGIDKKRIIKELMIIAYGRLSDCMVWDDNQAKLKPKDQLTEDQLSYIDSISFSRSETPTGAYDDDGKPIMSVRTSIMVGSIAKQKLAALKLLAQLGGMITNEKAGDVFNNTQNNLIFVAEWGTGAPIKKVGPV